MNIIRSKTQTRVAIGLAAVAIPVGYVIKKHLDWESTPEAKSRMLTHQLTFWAATGLGIWGLHKTFRSVIPLPWKILGTVLTAALPVVGFEGGQRLGARLFPKKPVAFNRNLNVFTPPGTPSGKLAEKASTRLFPGRVYVPPSLRNRNLVN
ncbi:MAG: hypothetical protein K2X01_10180 [Cyanobacteria bacterium]|nr:hypothetical protein [Cyanobacteriota bacterium]